MFDGITLTSTRPRGIVLSASQHDRFTLCQRWWAFEYLLKIKSPQKSSAELGTEVHRQLEGWLGKAIPIGADIEQQLAQWQRENNLPRDPKTAAKHIAKRREFYARASRIAFAMIKFLPAPGTGVTERRFFFTTRYGHHYTGFIDWSGYITDVTNAAIAAVIDHKTTSNFAEYAKKAEDLHQDVQAVVYSVVGFIGFNTEDLLLFWNYGTTGDRDAQNHPVRTRVHLPVVMRHFDGVTEEISSRIVLAHQNPNRHPNEFPPNANACGSFGGCPFANGQCNVTDQERLAASMMTSHPDMQTRMEGYPPQQPHGGQPNGTPPGWGGNPQHPGFPAPPPGMQPPSYGAPPQQTFGSPPQTSFGAPPANQQQQQPQTFAAPPPSGAPTGFSGPPPGYPQQPPAFGAPASAPNGGFQAPPYVAGGPNPPESVVGNMPVSDDAGKVKKERGRPAGAKNKELGVEGSIFMMGVSAGLSNPNITTGTQPPNPNMLAAFGEAAVAAYKTKFGG